MKRSIELLGIALLSYAGMSAAAAPALTLIKSPYCGCCETYVAYLQRNGFEVKVVNQEDMNAVKQRYGTANAASCHTALVGGYVVEGHVPVGAIHKLLATKPKIAGISLPGMPAAAPGMGEMQKGTLPVVALPPGGGVPQPFSVE